MSGLSDVYITGTGAFLPGPPIDNDRMEDHLGRIGGRDSLFGKKLHGLDCEALHGRLRVLKRRQSQGLQVDPRAPTI